MEDVLQVEMVDDQQETDDGSRSFGKYDEPSNNMDAQMDDQFTKRLKLANELACEANFISKRMGKKSMFIVTLQIPICNLTLNRNVRNFHVVCKNINPRPLSGSPW
jgi:hypothetical protein